MLAKKVLEVLRDRVVPHDSNEECPMCLECQWPGMAALITAAEHEAQADPSGWKPGSEPPEHGVFEIRRSSSPSASTLRHFAYRDHGVWRDYYMTYVIDDVTWWHDLPPLPEQEESAAAGKGGAG